MKVGFLHPNWQTGGVERTNLQWKEILESHNHQIATYTSNAAGKHNFNASSKLGLYLSFPFYCWRCDYLIVCQTYFLPWILIQLILLRFLGCKIIITERNSERQYDTNPIKKWVIGFILIAFKNLFHCLIFNSEEMSREAMYSKVKMKTYVVPNPRFSEKDIKASTAQRQQLNLGHLYTFCRWSEQKNIPMLQAANKICDTLNMSYAVHCDITDERYQLPMIDNAFEFMIKHPCVLYFCSKYEGFPNILLEARVAGLPIVYSKCETGVREILLDYENKFEFAANDEQSLTAAITRCSHQGKLLGIDRKLMKKYSVMNPDLENLLILALN